MKLRSAATAVIAPVLVGSALMAKQGAPPAMPLLNVAAALASLAGLAFAGDVLARRVEERPATTGLLALAFESAALADAGLDGVRRWVALGPLRLHAAAIGDPLLVLAAALLWERGAHRAAIALFLGGLALHVLGPDAAQAAALAGSALVLAVATTHAPARARATLASVAVAGALLAIARPDPLAPAAFVENVVEAAFAIHPLAGACALGSLALLPLAALGVARRPQIHRGTPMRHAVAAYAVIVALAALVGAFPTPILGFGVSPVVGLTLGLGLVDRLSRPHAASA